MNKKSTITSHLILFYLLITFSQSLFAHARWSLTGLIKPRSDATGLKEPAPCGGVARTSTATILKSGSTVDVQFEETINHPGHFRIAFSSAADNGFNQNILVDNIPEVTTTRFYTQTITLPDIECSDCTLQLIQVMTDRTPPTNYYSCADIQLTTTGTLPPPVDDTTPPDDVSQFTVTAGDTQVELNWQNPALDFSKVLVLQSSSQIITSPLATISYNLNETIGAASVIYQGNDTATLVKNLSNGSQYFFKIFAFDASFNYSSGLELDTTLAVNPENFQPVISLSIEQAQTETLRIIKNSGNVIIQASVSDKNPSDSHLFDWSFTDNRLIDIDSQSNNFTFNPAELDTGTYNIQVDVSDNGVPEKSTSATLSIEVVDAGVNAPDLTNGGGGLNLMTLLLSLLVFMVFRISKKA